MREAFCRLAERTFAPFLLNEARCPSCGRTFPRRFGAGGSLCPECLSAGAASPVGEEPPEPDAGPLFAVPSEPGPAPWGRILAAGPYAGRLRAMILAYKFEGRLDLGRQLQELLLATFDRGLAEFPELAACGTLVPVPLHPRRLLRRGYNQSREIARLLSVRRGLPIAADALRRVRRTAPQTTLGAAARRENIRGAFAARGAAVAGRSIILVDDVMTTGATLRECARTLLAAGAARTDVLVLARA